MATLDGMDALLAIVQMPPGIPVANRWNKRCFKCRNTGSSDDFNWRRCYYGENQEIQENIEAKNSKG